MKYLVLDEADKLFELGFVEQIDSVVKACSRTTVVRTLFSATLPETVEKLASTVMVDAVRIIIGRKYGMQNSIYTMNFTVAWSDDTSLTEQLLTEILPPR